MPKISNPYGFRLVKSKTSSPSFGSQEFPIAQANANGLIDLRLSTPSAATPATLSPAAAAPINAGLGMGDPVGFVYGTTTSLDAGLSSGTIGYNSIPLGNVGYIAQANTSALTYASVWPLVGIFSGLVSNASIPNVQRPSPVPYILNGTTVNVTNGKPATLYGTVSDQQWQVWQVQTNGPFLAAYTTAPNTPIGLNFNFTYGLGMNPSTGNSRAQLFTYNSYGTAGNVASITVPPNNFNNFGYFKIVGLAQPVSGQTNNWTDSFVDVLVVINNHYLSGNTYCANNVVIPA